MSKQPPQIIIPENLTSLTDEKLLNLLFDCEDWLPRRAVDEFTRRGERMIWPLWQIVKQKHYWEEDNGIWAPIHAVFILGAIGGREAVVPLIAALRFADAYECDWVWEALPSIFGRLGEKAAEHLKKLVLDMSNNWFVRGVAMESLASLTIGRSGLEREIFDFISSILKDQNEDMEVRSWAGRILLDFKQPRYKQSLSAFAQEAMARAESHDYYVDFDEDDVLEILSKEDKNLKDYSKEWLNFYQDEEIAARKKRWQEEKSKFNWFKRWWQYKTLPFKIRRLIKAKNKETAKAEKLDND